MKKTIKALKLPSIFLLILVSFIACDKDFTVIESDVLGKENSNFETNTLNIPILAYNKKLESLQINGLASNLFGVFNDPAFGQTTASIITQITPISFNPNFDTDPVIDSVVFKIPYYSRVIGNDTEGNPIYTIQDSLYGESEIRLMLYENNYFLRDFDPNSETNEAQNYYSKADGAINNTDNFALNGSSIINFDDQKGVLLKDTTFVPISDPVVLKSLDAADDEVIQRQVPALRFKLDKAFWTSLIIDKEDDVVLSNANNFKNYFRGLYLKAEAVNYDGSMVLLNTTSPDANITIYYTSGETDTRTQSTYAFNFNGNRLNTFINNYNLVTLEDGDKNLGDEKLYLKGTEGSMAVVDLFEDQSALDNFINEYRIADGSGGYLKDAATGDFILKKLINEAQLVVYEDETASNGGDEDFHAYDRIYAYDITNNTPTVDYFIDPSENTQEPFKSKVINLGQRIKDANNNFKYKIRLTQHINNILLKDSTNTKIGLVLSTNVNSTNNADILQSNDNVTAIPTASLLTPRGTVLYGTNASDENKKMKLNIFFTEPK
jgi:hypothetical protein